jgi:DNA-binding Lrp family transcriptional regulator
MRVPFIDPFRLGLECYTIGFRVREEAAEVKYIPLLVRAEQVAWVRRHATQGEYSMGIAAPSLGHVIDLFDDFLIGLRGTVTRNHFLVAESWSFFGHKTIGRLPVDRIPLRVGATHDRPHLDEFDQRVLGALMPRRHFDVGRVARELRVDAEKVTQSLEHLHRGGIVRGLTLRLASTALGRRRFDVLVRRRTADVRVKRDLELFAEEYPQVSVMTNFLGEWDHELTVEVERRAELSLFMKALRTGFGREIERIQWSETVEDLATSNIFP